jgi:hypothetical protein
VKLVLTCEILFMNKEKKTMKYAFFDERKLIKFKSEYFNDIRSQFMV